MTTAASTSRRLRHGATLLVVGLAALTVGVGPARADTTLSVPDRVTAAGAIPLRAHVDPAADPTRLTLTAPGQGAAVVLATNEGSRDVLTGGDLGYDLQSRCARYPGSDPCSTPVVAANGVWTLGLQGGQTARREFVIAVPATVPTAVTAAAVDPRTVMLRWPRGAEPDVRWTVLEGGAPLVSNLDPALVCSSEECEARISYPSDSARTRTLVLQATRLCPGCGDPAPAPVRSSPASATLPSAAPSSGPSQAPSASAGSGSTGAPTSSAAAPSATSRGGAGSAQPGVGKADRADFNRAIGTFVPPPAALSLPDAPPAPKAAPPAPVPPTEPDTFSGTLDYGGPRTVVEKDPQGVRAVTQALGTIGGALEPGRIWRAGAVALLLVMVAAHLRVWLAAPARD